MDRASVDWAGPMPAVTTPFHADGRINEAGFAANIERLLNDGATGVVVGGCTGEFWALVHDERKRLFEVAKDENRLAVLLGRHRFQPCAQGWKRRLGSEKNVTSSSTGR